VSSAAINTADFEAGRAWLEAMRQEAASGRHVVTRDDTAVTTLVDLPFGWNAAPSLTHVLRVALHCSSMDWKEMAHVGGQSALQFTSTTGGPTPALSPTGVVTIVPPSSGPAIPNGTYACCVPGPTGAFLVGATGAFLVGATGTFSAGGAGALSVPTADLRSDPSPTLSRCLQALGLRQAILSARQVAALETQLRALLSDEAELIEAGISLSIASLYGLFDFLAGNDDGLHPSLSITRDGYFGASWSPRRRAKLTLIFRGAGVVEWIATDLDSLPPGGSGVLGDIPDHFARWMFA
jgi:hypothetical protein